MGQKNRESDAKILDGERTITALKDSLNKKPKVLLDSQSKKATVPVTKHNNKSKIPLTFQKS